MTYFPIRTPVQNVERVRLVLRQRRTLAPGFRNAFFVSSGDILEVFFAKKGSIFMFEGICLAVRRKLFKNPNTSLVLRNSIFGVGIECTFSYFYNRVYFFKINDYKRKFSFIRKAKLFFLRKSARLDTKV